MQPRSEVYPEVFLGRKASNRGAGLAMSALNHDRDLDGCQTKEKQSDTRGTMISMNDPCA